MVAVTAPPPAVPSTTVWASLRCISSCIWLACESISGILRGLIILPPSGSPLRLLFDAQIDHAANFGMKDFFGPLHQRILESILLHAACEWHGQRRGGRAVRCAGYDQESRRRSQTLQFLANNLLRCRIHCEAQHLFAHSGDFDPQARGVEHPNARSQ